MTQAVGEYGTYSRGHATLPPQAPATAPIVPDPAAAHLGRRPPGVCVPWSAVRAGIGDIPGDESICRDVWNRIDTLANMFIWTMFLVF